MKQAMALLETGDAHEGAHIVEGMLAGLEEVGVDAQEMHLTLALSSARVEETAVSMHHMEHFLESGSDHEREAAEENISLLREGEIHDAVNELEEFLGEGHPEEDHKDQHQHQDQHEK